MARVVPVVRPRSPAAGPQTTTTTTITTTNITTTGRFDGRQGRVPDQTNLLPPGERHGAFLVVLVMLMLFATTTAVPGRVPVAASEDGLELLALQHGVDVLEGADVLQAGGSPHGAAP